MKAKTKTCKSCKKVRPEFVFLKNECDHCRKNQAQRKSKKHKLEIQEIRSERNRLLGLSDWTELTTARRNMTRDQRREWVEYRQKLRDITKNFKKGKKIAWPTSPD